MKQMPLPAGASRLDLAAEGKNDSSCPNQYQSQEKSVKDFSPWLIACSDADALISIERRRRYQESQEVA